MEMWADECIDISSYVDSVDCDSRRGGFEYVWNGASCSQDIVLYGKRELDLILAVGCRGIGQRHGHVFFFSLFDDTIKYRSMRDDYRITGL
jgi:hypothetical protein